jgi:predicted heme/steroid binding protein
VLTEHKERLSPISYILIDMYDRDDTLKWDEGQDELLFNGQDITQDIYKVAKAFNDKAYYQMGVLFAKTLSSSLVDPVDIMTA